MRGFDWYGKVIGTPLVQGVLREAAALYLRAVAAQITFDYLYPAPP